jgi:hypothetical protein|uniref:Uncharacterized protein n=1 Tax=Zea mays TaxID=4577 RepID=A0A804QJ42_MAIZE
MLVVVISRTLLLPWIELHAFIRAYILYAVQGAANTVCLVLGSCFRSGSRLEIQHCYCALVIVVHNGWLLLKPKSLQSSMTQWLEWSVNSNDCALVWRWSPDPRPGPSLHAMVWSALFTAAEPSWSLAPSSMARSSLLFATERQRCRCSQPRVETGDKGASKANQLWI